MSWPNDVDGDLFRTLAESGFDFAKPTLIDFNVSFRSWPPSPHAVARLCRDYPSVVMYEPESDIDGFLQFQVYALVTYEFVTNIQSEVTEMMAPFRGECSTWGVLVDTDGDRPASEKG
jgi:hypothetical protein